MLFKNARIYRIEDCPELGLDLGEALAEFRLKDCGRLEPVTSGWTSPYGRDHEGLVHSAGKCHLLRYGVQEKVLPPAVVRETLEERLSEARERLGRPVGRKEKLRMKDEVLMDLLPRAFVKPRAIQAYLDERRRWLVVDSASARQAEDLVGLLRQSLPGLRVQAPDLANRIVTHMTDWLESGDAPGELDLGDECDLRDDRDEKATARCRHQDLRAREIAEHLKAGKRAAKLGLVRIGRFGFSLSEEFALTRIRELELEVDRPDSEADPLAELDAQFVLMTEELGELLDFLAEEFAWA